EIGPVSLPRAKESIWPPIFSLFFLSACPIQISELGPVQTGRPPPGRGGRMGVGIFARLQHAPGIRQWDPRAEKLGPDLCFNMGPEYESGSRSPAIAYLEMGGVCALALVFYGACVADGRSFEDLETTQLGKVVIIIERYRRRESSVEEALIEMYLA